jgi:Leucine-rich repeat (LRR) protein
LNYNQIEEIDVRLFESLSNLKGLYLDNNKLKEIDRKCFEPLKSIEVIEIYINEALNVISFIKPSTVFKSFYFQYGSIRSISNWNTFLQQFPELGKYRLACN